MTAKKVKPTTRLDIDSAVLVTVIEARTQLDDFEAIVDIVGDISAAMEHLRGFGNAEIKEQYFMVEADL